MQTLISIILIGLAGAGMFGLIVIASISYTIPRVGVAAAIITIVAGQLSLGRFSTPTDSLTQ